MMMLFQSKKLLEGIDWESILPMSPTLCWRGPNWDKEAFIRGIRFTSRSRNSDASREIVQ